MLDREKKINVTRINPAKHASNLGSAHEHYVMAILIRWGFEVSQSALPNTPYDLLIYAYENGPESARRLIRAQVKTVKNSIPLTAGSRGGVDREYKSGVKVYKYSTDLIDLIIGVDGASMSIYLLPILLVQNISRSSISLSKLGLLKNNYELLLNWRPVYMKQISDELGLD